ncbi:putative 2-hydroxyacid dehydrogenase SE_1879 [Sceloporus undulatus]|uniref:putative 2-hydroxyacid dehydrogenase SE_1879 n=1 Tax=Sceloporus undulatus TaxID=8520 RepID=UPI001C4D3A0F|nr:putative 2-hydroxyacid dehydrogenase SE_1879 [Sceloporus undulatus]XP_042300029.1 putative 2-hydroxyacid dehydrogenase SE_1879 [Sceloporus undulatus]
MEGPELPVLLVNEVDGVLGVLETHLPFLKKHFHLITMKEFLENKGHFSTKVKAIYVWWHKPIIDRELLENLPNLKVIASSGVGMDHLDLKLISGYGVRMANAPHAVCNSTADIGMALLLTAARRLVEASMV